MIPDGMGFIYPKLDASKCVRCGLCEEVCPFNDNYPTPYNFIQPEPHGVRHNDIQQVENSQSGAAFIAVSDYILELGGVVYGVGYGDNFCVRHKRATTKKQRDEFRGSKYVQSNLIGVFQLVKEDLKNGLTVLFTGTPCQTAALNSILDLRLRQNLILVDIICNGVSGPFLWMKYIKYLEKKYKDKITGYNFRDKKIGGWASHRESFTLRKSQATIESPILFYNNITLRPSCGTCHYSNTRHPSDITIGDFWGWEKTDPNFCSDNKGLSLILINTQKGKDIYEKIKENLISNDPKLENCLQNHLRRPAFLPPQHGQFAVDFEKKGIKYVIKKYYLHEDANSSRFYQNVLYNSKVLVYNILLKIKGVFK